MERVMSVRQQKKKTGGINTNIMLETDEKVIFTTQYENMELRILNLKNYVNVETDFL